MSDYPILFAFYNFGKVRYNWIRLCAVKLNTENFKVVQLYAQDVIKTVNIVISHCCFAEDGTDLVICACYTCSTLIFLTRPIKLFICGVVVAVPIVYAKAL